MEYPLDGRGHQGSGERMGESDGAGGVIICLVVDNGQSHAGYKRRLINQRAQCATSITWELDGFKVVGI